MDMHRILRRFALAFVFAAAVPCFAQTISVGDPNPTYGGNLNPSGIQTAFQLVSAANVDASVSSATFGWSNTPCPAAVKLKFFRPVAPGNPQPAFSFVTERGPFDVTAPLNTTGFGPPATQTVILDPPVALRAGDIMAITNLTACGGPTLVGDLPLALPPPPPSSFSMTGDITTTVVQPSVLSRAVYVSAVGATSSLELLGRFQVTLIAEDPRTGRQTAGFPVPLNASAGYFSLPELTGFAAFPEVMVKMADATGTPSLGGTFWFFHAPLTDVRYTITVIDLTNRRARTYESPAATSGQLCGAADTSAFLP